MINKTWFGLGAAKRKGAKRRNKSSRAGITHSRSLLMEPLEQRCLLSVTAQDASTSIADPSLTEMVDKFLADITPHPDAAGLQHKTADTGSRLNSAQLSAYNVPSLPPEFPFDIPELTRLRNGIINIYNSILQDSNARPSIFGEATVLGGAEYRLYLDDNGMNISNWTIDWGDGSPLQTVKNQPWVIHHYADTSAHYEITASANGGVYAMLSDGIVDTRDVADSTADATDIDLIDLTADSLAYISQFADSLLLSDDGSLLVSALLGDDTMSEQVSMLQYASYQYTLDGEGEGGQGLDVEVQSVPPVLSVIGDQTASTGQDFILSEIGVFSHPSVTGTFSYQIDWGDGTDWDVGTPTIVSQGSDTSPLIGAIGGQHTYSAGGTYYVAATVIDPDGDFDTKTFLVTVQGEQKLAPALVPSSGLDPAAVSAGGAYYGTGDVVVSADDFGQGVTRSYSNKFQNTQDFGNGYGWQQSDQPYVTKSGSSTVVVFGPKTAYWFNAVGNDYVAQFGALQSLEHDSQNHVFVLTDIDGTVYQFSDFTYGGNRMGLFEQMTSIDGAMETVTAWTADGKIGEIQKTLSATTSPYESRIYSYFTTGDDAGRLESIILRTNAEAVTPNWIDYTKISYAYYGAGDANGLPGDLKTATKRQWEDLDWTGDSESAITYYRYYTDSAGGKGFEHALKMVVLSAGFAQAISDPLVGDPFAASDAALQKYCHAYYEYDSVSHSATTTQIDDTYEYVSATNTATWTFGDLTAPAYDVYVAWDINGSGTISSASFTVWVGGVSQGTFMVDQTVPPQGLTALGRSWYKLGSFNVTSGPLEVRLSASGSAIADTVYLAQSIPPTAPGNLQASMVSTSQINLTWTDNSDDEQGFIIEQSINDNAHFTQVGTNAANDNTYSVSGFTAGQMYWYRIRAYNVCDSGYSNAVNVSISNNAPVAPTNLTAATVSATQINLNWTDNSSNEQGFRIEISSDGGATYTQIDTIAANATAYNVINLTHNTEYYFRIRAYNSLADSAYSSSISSKTKAVPVAPTSLTATAVANDAVALSWTDNANNEQGFIIEQSTVGPDSGYSVVASPGTNVTSWLIASLTSNTRYWFRVKAYSGSADSTYSNVLNLTTANFLTSVGLIATATSPTQVYLTWSCLAADISGFKIEQSINDDQHFEQIGATEANVTSFTKTGLASSATYYFRIRAYNTAGNWEYSNTTNATTLPTPSVPSGLSATVVSNSQINLQWTDTSNNEDGFKIERSTDGTNFSYYTSVNANATSYLATSLTKNTQYWFRVYSYTGSTNSAFSNVVNATTTNNAPNAPVGLTAVATSTTQINLAWTNTDPYTDRTSFKIEESTDNGATYNQIGTASYSATSYSISSRTPGATYYYRIRACNTAGDSEYSNVVNATTLPTPNAPSSLVATVVSNSQINLTWTDNASNEDGFKIERSTVGPDTGFSVVVSPGTNATSWLISSLTSNTQYWFRIRAYKDSSTYSAYSNVVNATTTNNVPNTPVGLTAVATSTTQINLAWTNTDPYTDRTGFKIEESTDNGATYNQIGTASYSATNYSVSSRTPGATYYYRIRAYNSVGDSAYSNSANATTLPTPNAPTSLVATVVSNSQINLTWTDTSNNEDGFKIERSTVGPDTGFSVVVSPGTNATSWLISSLTSNTQYWFRIRAYKDSSTYSAYSGVATATTLATSDPTVGLNAPGSLAATVVSNSQINLTWTDTSSNEDGFKIDRSTDGTNFSYYTSVNANATSYLATSLTKNTQYWFRVYSYTGSTNSAFSNVVNATTTNNAPNAPVGLTAVATSTTQISLAWTNTDPYTDRTGFKIEESTDNGTTYYQIGTASYSATSYSISSRTPGATYYYRIRAYNSVGDSAYSNSVNATTLPTPNAPSSLVATVVSNSQINLTWTDNANNEDGFYIQRSTDGTNFSYYTSVNANATSYLATGLTKNTQYWFRVYSYTGSANSAYSNTASATTTNNVPNVPVGLMAVAASTTQINLAWTNTDPYTDRTGFKIEESTDNGATYNQIGTASYSATSYSISSRTPGATYFYRIRAYNSVGDSAYSNSVNATTLPTPNAPSSLDATVVSNSQINLTWTDTSSNEDGFYIQRSTDGTNFSYYTSINANVTSYLMTGLTKNTQYWFRVYSYTGSANSAFSNTASATTTNNVPNVPVGLMAVAASTTQINLAWTNTDPYTDRTGFKIEESTDNGATYNQIGTASYSATSYSINSRTPGATYYYRIRAYNSVGDSTYSNSANAVALLNTPTGLTPTSLSDTQVRLDWTAVSGASGYRIYRASDGSGTNEKCLGISTINSFTDSGVLEGQYNYYRVTAYSATANSAKTSFVNINMPVAAPTNLIATRGTDGRINLNWQDNSSHESGFVIQQSLNGMDGWSQIATVGSNVLTYIPSITLTSSTTYYFRIGAYYSSPSNAIFGSNAGIFIDTVTAPTAPLNLTANAVSGSQIDLSWTGSENATGYNIERKASFESIWTLMGMVQSPQTTFSATGLKEGGSSYSFRVAAFNSAGVSAYSNTAASETQNYAPTVVIPASVGENPVTISQSTLSVLATDDGGESSLTYAWSIVSMPTGGGVSFSPTGNNNAKNCIATFSNPGQYTLRATITDARGLYTTSDAVVTTVPWPVAPTNLSATAASDTQINLSWTDNADNETGFKIERSPNGSTWTQIDTVGANVTSYSDNGLTEGTRYYYRVRATNGNGDSAYTSNVNTYTLPAAPSNFAATSITSSQVVLSWQDNSGLETNYYVDQFISGTWQQIWLGGANSTTATITTQTYQPSMQYSFRVRAYAYIYPSYQYSLPSITTVATAAWPVAPTNLSATAASDAQINLSWTDNATNETGYKIERSTDNVNWTQIDLLGENATTYSDSGFSEGTLRYYRVRATNGNGDSGYSNVISARTLPTAPANLTVTAITGGQVSLSWEDHSGIESYYYVEQLIGATWTQIGSALAANTTSATIAGVFNPSMQYSFRVRAYSYTGYQYSLPSNVAQATSGTWPVAPTNLSATAASDTQLNLSWTDNATNETGYKIERSTDNVNWTQIDLLGENATTYSDGGFSEGALRYYRVRAVNGNGDSGYSNVISARTLPTAPANLTVTAITGGQVSLSWEDHSGIESYYYVEQLIGATWTQIGSALAANTTSATIAGVFNPSMQYSFRVRAYGYQYSLPSNVAQVTTVGNYSVVSIQMIQAPDEYHEQPGIFRVTRVGNSLPITVGFSITGDATPGVDYEVPANSFVEFSIGETSKDIIINVTDDGIMEDNESFGITLAGGEGYFLVPDASQIAAQVYDGTMDQWHLVGEGTIVDEKVFTGPSRNLGQEQSLGNHGAWRRLPPQDEYGVVLNVDLKTWDSSSHDTFYVGISTTHLTSSNDPSGQYSWGGSQTQVFQTETDPYVFHATGSTTTPMYLNAYLRVSSYCSPQSSCWPSWGTLDPQVIIVDLDADANRDNDITDADDQGESQWTTSRGTIVLPNADDDDGDHYTDNSDATVNNSDDIADIGTLRLNKFGIDSIPDNMTVEMKVEVVPGEDAYWSSNGILAQDRIRIFRPTQQSGDDLVIQVSDSEIIGPTEGVTFTFSGSDLDDFTGDGFLYFGIEGIKCGAPVLVTVTAKIGTTVLATDKVQVKVSPFIASSNKQDVDVGQASTSVGGTTVYVSDLGNYSDGNLELRNNLDTAFTGHVAEVLTSETPESWWQDTFEIGYVQAPYGQMQMIFELPRARRQSGFLDYVRTQMMRDGVGLITDFNNDPSWDNQDDGGNFEVQPGYGPYGRIVMAKHGSDAMNSAIVDFLMAQGVQDVVDDLDLTWMGLGHVDEVVSFASSATTRARVASPEAAWALLVIASKEGQGAAAMLQDMNSLGSGGRTVDQILNDATLRADNFAIGGYSDSMLDVRHALGFTDPVSTPVLGTGTPGAVLRRAGYLEAYDNLQIPGATLEWRLLFDNSSDTNLYKIQYRRPGDSVWTDDGTGSRLEDSVSDSKVLYIIKDWWTTAATAYNDVITI